MSLLVVGSIAYDTVETAYGRGEDVLGGSCTYFSMAARHFTEPRIVGVVGDDFLEEHLTLLASHGICLAGLSRAPGKTFRWGGRYAEDGINRTTLFTHLNVFETFQPELPARYRDSEYVFLANIEPRLQLAVLDDMVAPRIVALDTMDLWIHTQRDALLEVIRRTDILFVNDSEALALTGQRLMAKAAHALLAMGPRCIVIKRGEHGALLWSADDVFLAPALPLDSVFDPTGAGDTFAGGFLGYLARAAGQRSESAGCDSQCLRQAMVVGTVMASFCVESFGLTRLAAVQREDIQARVDRLTTLTTFVPPTL